MAEYNIYHSTYTAQQIQDAIGKEPEIDPDTGNWLVWNVGTSAYTDTGKPSRGATGYPTYTDDGSGNITISE